MKHLGLGCLKPPYDPRDYQFSELVMSIDKTIYPEEYIPEYKVDFFDQGETNMCCACATAMSRYIYELNDSGNIEQMSPMYIYGNRAESSIQDGVYEGEGMYLKDALKQLINSGDCKYTDLPGFGNYSYCKNQYLKAKDDIDAKAHPFRVSSYYAVKTNKQVMKAILETGSVLAGFLVTEGWYTPDDRGVITTSGDIEGGHAVLITGWKMIDGKRHWIIMNSWGNDWADHGYGYIDANESFMEGYCILDEVHELKLKQVNK